MILKVLAGGGVAAAVKVTGAYHLAGPAWIPFAYTAIPEVAAGTHLRFRTENVSVALPLPCPEGDTLNQPPGSPLSV